MKKILLLTLLIVGLSSISFSQSAGKGGSEKSGGFFKRMFKKEQSPRGQMRHFDKQKKDPNMKNNGTSYRRNRKSKYTVDGDGFGAAGQGKQKKRRKK